MTSNDNAGIVLLKNSIYDYQIQKIYTMMIIRELNTISKANKKRNYQKSNCVRIVKKVKSVLLYITLTT